jgi:hypothetical protein
VRSDLVELPTLYAECELALTPFPVAFKQKVRGGETTGLALNEAAADARTNIISRLASWSGMVADERGVARPARRDVPCLAAFLASHLDWLLAHPAGPDFVDEVAAMAATARRAGRPDAVPQLELGRCVEEDCDRPLFATTAAQDTRSSVQVRCESGHVWRSNEWLLLARRFDQGS